MERRMIFIFRLSSFSQFELEFPTRLGLRSNEKVESRPLHELTRSCVRSVYGVCRPPNSYVHARHNKELHFHLLAKSKWSKLANNVVFSEFYF